MKDIKKYYVYELRNSKNQVEYVGYTAKPYGYRSRLYQHTCVRPGHSGNGLFYGRTDITMHVVHETEFKKEALQLEGKLKLSHGLEWTEKINNTDVGLRNRKLTQDHVIEIRYKYVPRKYTMRELANEYGVSYKTIWSILKNEIYKQF